MKISLEVSLYSFEQDFVPRVKSFIDTLNDFSGITVTTNAMSTQIFGEFDHVMECFSRAMKKHFQNSGAAAFVVKFLNCDARQYLPND